LYQGTTLVGPFRASKDEGFSPCCAISLSVRLRAAFDSSTCEENIAFAAFAKYDAGSESVRARGKKATLGIY